MVDYVASVLAGTISSLLSAAVLGFLSYYKDNKNDTSRFGALTVDRIILYSLLVGLATLSIKTLVFSGKIETT